jgi:hypothetical protein
VNLEVVDEAARVPDDLYRPPAPEAIAAAPPLGGVPSLQSREITALALT